MKVERKSVIKDIILTILTFGIWNIYVQIRQIHETNQLIGKDKIPHFIVVFLLSILTLGIYFAYHEYCLTKELHKLNYGKRFELVEYVMAFSTFFGFWFFVDSYQQTLINKYIDDKNINTNICLPEYSNI